MVFRKLVSGRSSPDPVKRSDPKSPADDLSTCLHFTGSEISLIVSHLDQSCFSGRSSAGSPAGSGRTSRIKQETDGSRHSTAPSGAQNALCGLDFRKVRQILLRLRQKISSIEAKEPKLWMFEEGQSISSLESRQAWTRPEPPKRLILLSPNGDSMGVPNFIIFLHSGCGPI